MYPYRGSLYCLDDPYLLSSFLELIQIDSIDGGGIKLLLKVLRFLRLCDYSGDDIIAILAHASAYFKDAFAHCGSHMEAGEVGNILATLIFIAHCYVQDETCPLHVWHQHLFKKYCTVKVLNSAVIRLMELRRYILRLDDAEMNQRMLHLHHSLRLRDEHTQLMNSQSSYFGMGSPSAPYPPQMSRFCM